MSIPDRLAVVLSRATVAVRVLLVVCVVAGALPAGAAGEQASEPASPAASRLDAGGYHSCAVLVAGSVRCWGFGADGQLGYGNTNTIGDDETPGSVGPVNLGAGHTVTAIAAGDFHTCALLKDGSVRCWGFGGDGRLGYGNTTNVSDPGSAGPVNLGGRAAVALTAGAAHTCAVLDDGNVRCWGAAGSGQLGYGNTDRIGDTETPGSVGPVKLGGSAVAISAGGLHTCALLTDGNVRCWGKNDSGQLGYGNPDGGIGGDRTPDSAGPVELGLGRKAVAISAGNSHTCAVLDNGSVRCWGEGGAGQLGYGNRDNIGDSELPDSVAPVSLGPGKAVAVSAGDAHTCVVLDDGSVRCWGLGASGRLGYGNQSNIGDNETPASAGPVDLGSGRTATAVSAGGSHTCVRLDDGSVRCWGYGVNGQLGYCNQNSIGDDESPGEAGPVDLGEPGGGAGCPSPPPAGSVMGPPAGAAPTAVAKKLPVVGSEALRARGLHSCVAAVAGHAKRETRLLRHGSARRRARVRRHLSRHATSGRRRCLRVFGRTPGRATGLRAHARSKTQIELSFDAPGTDGTHAPPAHSYLIKQSLRPIRGAHDFTRAQTLCKGHCRFTVSRVGGKVSLTVTDLHPHTTYYYAVVARDNVSAKAGLRSPTVKATTR